MRRQVCKHADLTILKVKYIIYVIREAFTTPIKSLIYSDKKYLWTGADHQIIMLQYLQFLEVKQKLMDIIYGVRSL